MRTKAMKWVSAKVIGLALGGVILLGAAGTASASDWDHDCGRRIAQEQHELDRAIAQQGFYSRQADHERHELARIEAGCGYR